MNAADQTGLCRKEGENMGLMEKILGDMNSREVKKIEKIAEKEPLH